MASIFYTHHGAYGLNLNRLGLDNPILWGSPQEGDGSGKYASTSASLAAVVLTAQPAAGDTLVIAGAIFTASASAPTAGAAAFQIGADLATTANNIVNAINNCTATTLSASLVNGAPQIRNVLFARSVVANKVEIMCRIGTQRFNYNASTNTLPAITTSATWAGSAANLPTVTQFAGGVGGCWGWLINTIAFGVANSLAQGGYGMWCMTGTWKPIVSCTADAPTVSALPTLQDKLIVRAPAGTTKITIANGYAPIAFNKAYNENWIVDGGIGSGTYYTEDPGDGIIAISHNITNTNVNIVSAAVGYVKSIGCITPYTLRILGYQTSSAGGQMYLTPGVGNFNCPVGFFNILYGEDPDSPYAISQSGVVQNAMTISTSGVYSSATFTGCKISFPSPRTNAFVSGAFFTGTITGWMEFNDCTFEWNFIGTIDPGPISSCAIAQNGALRFRNCRFKGAPTTIGKFRAQGPLQPAQVSRSEILFENCSGLKLDAYIGFQNKNVEGNPSLPYYYLSSNDMGRAFRYETWQAVTEWNPDATTPQPLLRAVQDDGTAWSTKFDWLAVQPDLVSDFAPFTIAESELRFIDTSKVATVEFEIFVRAALLLDSSNMYMRVAYVDANGLVQTENTRFNPAMLKASTAVWSRTGSFNGYVPKKFSLTTKVPVKQNSTIVASLIATTVAPTGANETVFIDNDIVVS